MARHPIGARLGRPSIARCRSPAWPTGREQFEILTERHDDPLCDAVDDAIVDPFHNALGINEGHDQKVPYLLLKPQEAPAGMLRWMRPDTVKSATLLREARLRAGLSQGELAERSGKPRPHIGRYEAGAVAPSLDTLVELVRACGFDVSLDLVTLDDSDDPSLAELQQLSPERRLDRMLDVATARGRR